MPFFLKFIFDIQSGIIFRLPFYYHILNESLLRYCTSVLFGAESISLGDYLKLSMGKKLLTICVFNA